MQLLPEIDPRPSLEAMVRALNGEASAKDILGRFFPDYDGNEEDDFRKLLFFADLHKRMRVEFLRVLRSCVNRWIDSGIDTDGTERPHRRHLDDLLFDLLEEWKKRNPPLSLVTEDGIYIIGKRRPQPREPLQESLGEDVAVWWFVKLLEDPRRNRVARCANPKCGGFFLRKREPRKELIHGVCCKNCAGIASAERTTNSRNRKRDKFVQRAAAILIRDTARGGRSRSAAWIAERMNRDVRADLQVTPNKVTRNLSLIDAEVRRQQDQQHHNGRK